MRYHLTTLGLAPLLLLQGRRVRRNTPRLPEPPGARTGMTGTGPSLRLLVLGDSAAAGVGAGHQDEALAGRLAHALGRGFTVHWTLLATTGHTLRDVLGQLATAEPDHFDVVVTSIGVNDATAGTGRRAWLGGVKQLIRTLRERHRAAHIVLSAVPPMHLFPALPQPLRWYMGLRVQRLNAASHALVAREPACVLAAPDFPFEPAYMAADGFHPSPRAYARWAEHVADLIRARLRAGAPAWQSDIGGRERAPATEA